MTQTPAEALDLLSNYGEQFGNEYWGEGARMILTQVEAAKQVLLPLVTETPKNERRLVFPDLSHLTGMPHVNKAKVAEIRKSYELAVAEYGLMTEPREISYACGIAQALCWVLEDLYDLPNTDFSDQNKD